MKNGFVFLLLAALVLGSCKSKKEVINEEKEWRDSGYDFTHLRRYYHKGLNVYLPSYFTKDYSRSHLLKQNAMAVQSVLLSLHLSVEHFSAEEAAMFKSAFPDIETLQEGVQSHYVNRRTEKLYSHSLSLSAMMPAKSKLDGYYHVIEGTSRSYSDELMYFIGTVEKKIKGTSHFYVVQLVCPKDVAAYVTDDYRRILRKLH